MSLESQSDPGLKCRHCMGSEFYSSFYLFQLRFIERKYEYIIHSTSPKLSFNLIYYVSFAFDLPSRGFVFLSAEPSESDFSQSDLRRVFISEPSAVPLSPRFTVICFTRTNKSANKIRDVVTLAVN